MDIESHWMVLVETCRSVITLQGGWILVTSDGPYGNMITFGVLLLATDDYVGCGLLVAMD